MIKGSSCLICLSFGDRDRGRLPYYCAKNISGRLPGSGSKMGTWALTREWALARETTVVAQVNL